MLRQVNLARVDAERAGYVFDGQLLDYVKVEYLVLFGIYPGFDPFQGGVNQVLLPFFIPNRIQDELRRVWNPLQSGRARGLVEPTLSRRAARQAFSELVENSF